MSQIWLFKLKTDLSSGLLFTWVNHFPFFFFPKSHEDPLTFRDSLCLCHSHSPITTQGLKAVDQLSWFLLCWWEWFFSTHLFIFECPSLCLGFSFSSCLLVLKPCSLFSRSQGSKFLFVNTGEWPQSGSNFQADCTLIFSSCLLHCLLKTFLNFLQIQFYKPMYPAFAGIFIFISRISNPS